MVGNGGVTVLGVLFTVIAARGLSPDNFGVMSALLSLVVVLATIGDIGISSALVNFLPKFKTDRHTIISLTFWIQFSISLILCLLLIVAAFFKDKIIPGSTVLHFWLIALMLFVQTLSGFSRNIFTADRRFFLAAINQWLESFPKVLVLGYFFFFSHVTIDLAIATTVVGVALAAIFGLSFETSNIRFIFPKKHLLEVFQFTKWIALVKIFSVFVSRVDVILLNALSSSYQAGLFAAASRVAMPF
jgi:teichuronic acid exporter